MFLELDTFSAALQGQLEEIVERHNYWGPQDWSLNLLSRQQELKSQFFNATVPCMFVIFFQQFSVVFAKQMCY